MLNVCFGDSECGALKHALRDEQVTFSYRALELGGIHPDYFEEARKEWIDDFFGICSKRKRAQIWKEEQSRVALIIDSAKKEKEVRIWYASSPCSLCGYYKVVDMLQEIDCKIYAVEMPGNIGYREPPYQKSWGEANPEQMLNCVKLQKELTKAERNDISQKWKVLEKEDTGLRLNIDGVIKNVPINYLDEEILSYAPIDKEFRMGEIVGQMIGKSIHAVSDSFIADRVESLIDGGSIIVLQRAKKRREYYYQTFLRLATEEDKEEYRRKGSYVMDFLEQLGIDYYAIGQAIEDGKLEKNYEIVMKYPKMTKKQALKRLNIEEYESNPLPPGERTYTDADFKKKRR